MDVAGIPIALMALAAAIVVLAVVVQTTTGMGFGLTAAPLLAMIDTRMVPVPILVLGMVTAIIAASKERQIARFDEAGWGLAGRFAGMIIALGLLVLWPDRSSFALMFSVGILLAIAMSIAGLRFELSRRSLLAMGTLSGLMGTITSVGAPPMALIYQNVRAEHARATLNTFFAAGAAISFLGLLVIGRVTMSDVILVAFLAPVMLATTYFAPRLNASVARRYRPVVLSLSAIAAVNLLFRALFGS